MHDREPKPPFAVIMCGYLGVLTMILLAFMAFSTLYNVEKHGISAAHRAYIERNQERNIKEIDRLAKEIDRLEKISGVKPEGQDKP